MKIFSCIIFLLSGCFFNISNLFGKEVKPQVLIYGDNIESFAVAMQSARSNVPTLWVIPSTEFCTKCDFKIVENNFGSGIWMNILQEIAVQNKKSDSLFNGAQPNLSSPDILRAVYKLMSNQSNLTILKDVKVTSILNKKKNIDVVLSNKKKLNVISVVDATSQLELLFMANEAIQIRKIQSQERTYEGPIQNLGSDMLRTLVAIGNVDNQLYGFTVQSILARRFDNLFFLSATGKPELDRSSFITKLNLGQAIGASAAYCAFFKTAFDKVDVRKLQTELMSFDSRLFPFVNVSIEDPNFNSLQKFFLTQILSSEKNQMTTDFNGSDSVAVESVRLVLQQFYSRAQLWFFDNKSVYFTVKDAVELLKVLAFRGDELDNEIAKAWSKRFKFSREFNLNLLISHYEFAVLLNAYADPFAKKVSIDGLIQR